MNAIQTSEPATFIGDLSELPNLIRIIKKVQPRIKIILYPGAQKHVA